MQSQSFHLRIISSGLREPDGMKSGWLQKPLIISRNKARNIPEVPVEPDGLTRPARPQLEVRFQKPVTRLQPTATQLGIAPPQVRHTLGFSQPENHVASLQ